MFQELIAATHRIQVALCTSTGSSPRTTVALIRTTVTTYNLGIRFISTAILFRVPLHPFALPEKLTCWPLSRRLSLRSLMSSSCWVCDFSFAVPKDFSHSLPWRKQKLTEHLSRKLIEARSWHLLDNTVWKWMFNTYCIWHTSQF